MALDWDDGMGWPAAPSVTEEELIPELLLEMEEGEFIVKDESIEVVQFGQVGEDRTHDRKGLAIAGGIDIRLSGDPREETLGSVSVAAEVAQLQGSLKEEPCLPEEVCQGDVASQVEEARIEDSDGKEIAMTGDAEFGQDGDGRNSAEFEGMAIAAENCQLQDSLKGVPEEVCQGKDASQMHDTRTQEQVPGGREIVMIGDADLGQDGDEMKSAELEGIAAEDSQQQNSLKGVPEEVCQGGDAGQVQETQEQLLDGKEIAVTGDAGLSQVGDERKNAELQGGGARKVQEVRSEEQEPDGKEISMTGDADLGQDGDERQGTDVVGGTSFALEDGELQDRLKEDSFPQGAGQMGVAEPGRAVLFGGSLSAQGLEGLGYVLTEDSDSEDEDEYENVLSVGNLLRIKEDSSSDDDISSTSGSSSDEEEHIRLQPVKQNNKPEEKKKLRGESSDDDVVEPPRTKNEIAALPPVPKIDVVLQPHHVLRPFGVISSVLGKHLIVQTSGSISTVGNALNEGSILWLAKERVPLGLIDEVFGPVKTPYYLVRFNDEAEIPDGAVESAEVAAVPEFVSFIIDKDPELYKKGYDASGCNDEELSDEEIEFSDDEEEAAYKKAAARKNKPLQGRDETRPGNGVHDVPAFLPNQRDRSSRGGRGRGQQRGRSRFGDQHKTSREGSNGTADFAMKRIADMDIQLPSTSQQPRYNERGRHSEGGSHRGNHSRPLMGRTKFRPRSDGSESEAMSTRTDGSAGSAADEVISNRSPFLDHGMQQGQSPGLSLPPPGWGSGNLQGYRPPYPGIPPNQGFGMQFPAQGRHPQGARPVAPGGWATPGMVNGGPIHQPVYQHPGYGNFIHQQHAPPLAVGPTGFAPHQAYGIPLGDRGFNMAVNTGPLPGHAGSGGFYPANVHFSHLPHMVPQQGLSYVNPLGFIPQQPGNVGQTGYSLNAPYSPGGLVYMDNSMRQPSQNPHAGFNPQLSQAGGIMYQQNPLPNQAFNSPRPPMNDSFARRSRPGP